MDIIWEKILKEKQARINELEIKLKEREKTVWIVSWYNRGEMPVVTPFNNEDAAKRYYDYELNNNHEKVDLDKCEVYSTFTQFGG